jgi:hypothetical protein
VPRDIAAWVGIFCSFPGIRVTLLLASAPIELSGFERQAETGCEASIVMIPYIEVPRLRIWGAVAIQPFGLLVVIGCLTGLLAAVGAVRFGTADCPSFK